MRGCHDMHESALPKQSSAPVSDVGLGGAYVSRPTVYWGRTSSSALDDGMSDSSESPSGSRIFLEITNVVIFDAV